jgi:hypothetical protein
MTAYRALRPVEGYNSTVRCGPNSIPLPLGKKNEAGKALDCPLMGVFAAAISLLGSRDKFASTIHPDASNTMLEKWPVLSRSFELISRR